MKLSQEVQIYDDEPKKTTQSVTIDKEDQWLSIQHGSHEICLRLENWLKLVDLAQKLINQYNALNKN